MNEENQIKYYQTIDIEAINNTDVTGIGMCVGNSDGITLYKKDWWITPDLSKMDKKCKAEFWDKNPGAYKAMIKYGLPEQEQIRDFVKEFDGQANEFGINEIDLRQLSDNSEFDYGRLAPYIKNHCDREPLRYTTKKEYRPITDLGDGSWCLGTYSIIKSAVTEIQEHDHFPSNDAEHIFLTHIITDEVFNQLGKRLRKEIDEITEDVVKSKKESILVKRMKLKEEKNVRNQ